jgi:hypothetical protein
MVGVHRRLMRRLGRYAGQSAIALAAVLLLAAPAQGGRDRLAVAIESRLAHAHLFPYSTASNWGNRPFRPEYQYEVFTGPSANDPIYFDTWIYKTAAEAQGAYKYVTARANQIEGPQHPQDTYAISGRVVFSAYTYVPSGQNEPPVPLKTFRSLIAVAGGS